MDREQIILLSKKNLRYMRRNTESRRYYTREKIAAICGISVQTLNSRLREYKIK